MAWNNKCLLFHFFCRSGILERLSWVVWGKGLSGGCCQDVGWYYILLKAWLGLEDILPADSLTCYLDASISCHVDLCIGLLECPDHMAASFPQSEWFKTEQNGSLSVFLLPNFRSHMLSFLQNSGGVYRDMNAKKWSVTGDIPKASYHSHPLCLK